MSKRSRGEAMLAAMKKGKKALGPKSDHLEPQSSANSETSTSILTTPQDPLSYTPKSTTKRPEVKEEGRREAENSCPRAGSKSSSPQSEVKPIFRDQSLRLINQFKFLEVAMNNMGRKRVVVWSQVSKYVEQLSSDSFDLQDLALILTVWPKCVTLKWRVVALDSLSPAEMNLCLALAPLLPLVESADGEEAPQKERGNRNRMDIFKEKLQQHTKNSGGVVLAASGAIPEKEGGDTGTDSNKRRGAKSAARGRATGAVASMGMSGASMGMSRNAFGTVNVDPKASIPSMEELWRMAREKEREAVHNASLLAAEKLRSQAEQRLKALPVLCDSLRSHSKAKKHQSCPVLALDVINELSHGATAPQGGVSTGRGPAGEIPDYQEMLARLRIIAREVPEFLTVCLPDKVLPHHTLTVHLSTPYAEVRKKMALFVQTATVRLDEKYRRHQELK